MGFNRRKMEDQRREAAEKEAANRRATDAQVLEDVLKQVNQLLRDQLDDMRGQRDKWEQAAQTALRQLPAPKAPARSRWWSSRRAA